MAYFKYFPNTVYNAVDVNEKKYRLVTNILRTGDQECIKFPISTI